MEEIVSKEQQKQINKVFRSSKLTYIYCESGSISMEKYLANTAI